jgi:type IV secretion system protein VirD4
LEKGRIRSYTGCLFEQAETAERYLLSPDEVLRLPKDKMLVLTSELDCPPILALKIPYFKYRNMNGRYLPNPYHPPKTHAVVQSLMGSRKRKVITREVPEHLAHWPQFQKGFYSYLK